MNQKQNAGGIDHTDQTGSATVIPLAQVRTVRSDKKPAELIAFRISAEQRQQLNRTAKQRRTSVSELVRQMISEQLSA